MRLSASPPSMRARPKMRFAPSRCSTRCCRISSPTPSRRRTLRPTTGPISQDDFEDMEDNQVPDEQVDRGHQAAGHQLHPDEKYLKDRCKASGADPKRGAGLASGKVCCRRSGSSRLTRQTALQTQGEPDKAFASAAASSKDCTACLGHHPLLPGIARHGVGVADRQGPAGPHLDAESVRHRAADCRAAGHSRRQHSGDAADTSAAASAASSRPTAGASPPRSFRNRPAASRSRSCWSAQPSWKSPACVLRRSRA